MLCNGSVGPALDEIFHNIWSILYIVLPDTNPIIAHDIYI